MRAVLVSVAVHAVAVLAIGTWGLTQADAVNDRHIESVTPQIEVFEPIESAPIEIAIVTLPAAASEGAASQPTVGTHIGRGITRGTEAAAGAGIDDTHVDPAQPSGWFQMRGLRHDLSVPGAMIDRIANERGQAPEVPQHDERLEPSGRGTHTIYDRVTTMRVAADGSAKFKDKKDISIHFNPLRMFHGLRHAVPGVDELRHGLGDMIGDWRKDPYRDQRAGRVSDLPRHVTAVPGACDSFGDLGCDPPDNSPYKRGDDDDGGGGGLFGGKLDITSYLHRKFVGDPYASRKLKLLDSTRDERARIGATYRAEQLGRSGELTLRNLQSAWRLTDAAARRAAAFALWDDCAEGEGALGEAGERARKVVLGWIAVKLPAGSSDAFTVDEIARFDAARTSHQHFAPYSQ